MLPFFWIRNTIQRVQIPYRYGMAPAGNINAPKEMSYTTDSLSGSSKTRQKYHIKEIADRWGGTMSQNVVKFIRI